MFGNRKGPDALAEFVRTFYKSNNGNVRHWNSQLVITPTAEGANGTTYFFLLDVSTRAITTTGIYKCLTKDHRNLAAFHDAIC